MAQLDKVMLARAIFAECNGRAYSFSKTFGQWIEIEGGSFRKDWDTPEVEALFLRDLADTLEGK